MARFTAAENELISQIKDDRLTSSWTAPLIMDKWLSNDIGLHP